VNGEKPVGFSPIVSPDGKWLLTSGDDEQVCARRLARPELPPIVIPDCPADDPTFSPDGKSIAMINARGEVGIWDLANGARRAATGLTPSAGAARELVFSPRDETLAIIVRGDGEGRNGRMASEKVVLWRPAAGAKPRILPLPPGEVKRLGFTNDGKTLICAVADNDGQSMRCLLLDVASGSIRATAGGFVAPSIARSILRSRLMDDSLP
jgi:Tol biopolymer transport system component